MPGRIADIRDPELFQRLVRTLFAAERGHSFQVVDDSSGDRGNDGYDSESGWLVAIYCPEKGMQRKAVLEKGRSDLWKAFQLAKDPAYRFKEWVFITPEPLPEIVQTTLREEAASGCLRATFLSAENLEPIFLKFPHLHDLFPELVYPKVQAELASINSKLDDLLKTTATAASGDVVSESSLPENTSTVSYSVDLFPGFRSDALADLQKRLYLGDQEARHELERYRLEATDRRDRLVALLIELDYEAEHLRHQTVQRLASEGLSLASSIAADAEAAVFRARLTYATNAQLVLRESRFIGQLGMSVTIGMPLVGNAEADWYDHGAPKERKEINESFKTAYAEGATVII